MSYRTALKYTMRRIPLSMIDRDLWLDLVQSAQHLALILCTIAIRVVSLALFPLSALLLAALVAAHERRLDRLRQEWHRTMKESPH